MAEVQNAKPYDDEKAWHSINHSLFSDQMYYNKLPDFCEKMYKVKTTLLQELQIFFTYIIWNLGKHFH